MQLAAARRQAAEILANASAAKAAAPGSGGQTAGGLVGAMRGMGLEDAGPAVPTRLLRAFPAVHTGGCSALAFNRAGTVLASGGGDRVVRLWDMLSGAGADRPVATLQGCLDTVNALTWTGDGRHVVAAETRSALRCWAADSGRLVASLTGHRGRVTGVAAPARQPETLASCASDRTIKLWTLDKGLCTRTLMCHSTCNALGWAMGGDILASVHFDGALRLWDPRTGRQVNELAGLHNNQIICLDVAPSGVLAATAGKDNLVRVVDLKELRVVATLSSRHFSVGSVGSVVAFSEDEQHVAAGSADASVLLWELGRAGGSFPTRLASTSAVSPVTALAWSPLGSPLVTATKGGGVCLWGPEDKD